jgi:hypothetical protein
MLFLKLYLEIVYHLWLERYDELVGESRSQFPTSIWKLSLPHRSRFVPAVPTSISHSPSSDLTSISGTNQIEGIFSCGTEESRTLGMFKVPGRREVRCQSQMLIGLLTDFLSDWIFTGWTEMSLGRYVS